jgi:hypothetical protein
MSFHNLRDKNGRFRPKDGSSPSPAHVQPVTQAVAQQQQSSTVPNPEPPKLINHIAILLDSSGSISNRGLTTKMIEAFNQQVSTIKEQAYKTKQETYFSFYTFGAMVGEQHYRPYQIFTEKQIKLRQASTHVEAAEFLTQYNYQPYGNTPLVYCLEQAINDLSKAKKADDANTSFLLIIITDGEDTESNLAHKEQVRRLVEQKTNTDRWTFTCAGPAMARNPMLALGFPQGNIHVFETTQQGVESMGFAAASGVQMYAAARSAGAFSVKSFYQTNLTNVKPEDIKGLQDWTNKFRRLAVTKDTPIADFVQAQGLPFSISKGFYELTKSEEIQAHKELALVNQKTGETYGGLEAKQLLGLPTDKTFKVKPGDHAGYKLFVQSTSANRKLIAGTEFLYRLS